MFVVGTVIAIVGGIIGHGPWYSAAGLSLLWSSVISCHHHRQGSVPSMVIVIGRSRHQQGSLPSMVIVIGRSRRRHPGHLPWLA